MKEGRRGESGVAGKGVRQRGLQGKGEKWNTKQTKIINVKKLDSNQVFFQTFWTLCTNIPACNFTKIFQLPQNACRSW